jgi:TRAP-type transport system small permease protein
MFSGALAQARINLDVRAPVTGASMATLYSAGIVFAVAAAVFLVHELWLVLTGQLSDKDLVMVKESEEQEQLEGLQAELAREHAEIPAHLQPPVGVKK